MPPKLQKFNAFFYVSIAIFSLLNLSCKKEATESGSTTSVGGGSRNICRYEDCSSQLTTTNIDDSTIQIVILLIVPGANEGTVVPADSIQDGLAVSHATPVVSTNDPNCTADLQGSIQNNILSLVATYKVTCSTPPSSEVTISLGASTTFMKGLNFRTNPLSASSYLRVCPNCSGLVED